MLKFASSKALDSPRGIELGGMPPCRRSGSGGMGAPAAAAGDGVRCAVHVGAQHSASGPCPTAGAPTGGVPAAAAAAAAALQAALPSATSPALQGVLMQLGD